MLGLSQKRKIISISNLLYIAVLLAITLVSCKQNTSNERYVQLIEESGSFVDSDPIQGLSILKKVKADELNESDYHYYVLVRTRLSAAVGLNIKSMAKDVDEAYRYFFYSDNRDTAAIVLSYFVLAKVDEAMGDPNKAYANYRNADSWAERIGYNTPHVIYSAIPYNIAFHAKRFREYRTSLGYLDKMEGFIDTAKNHQQRYHLLYSLELRGINYMYLNQPDSAFYYYDAAMNLADRLDDERAKSRVTCNRIEMLADLADPYEAESRSKELLKEYTHTNDSLFIALTNISLAKIYTNLCIFDQAYERIDNAIKYIHKDDISNQVLVYHQLKVIVEREGNMQRLAKYINKFDFIFFERESTWFNEELRYLYRRKLGHILSQNISQ